MAGDRNFIIPAILFAALIIVFLAVNVLAYIYDEVPDSYKDNKIVAEILGTYKQSNGYFDENVYTVKFLYSNDTSIQRGWTGNLEIYQDAANGSYRIPGFAPEGIVPDLIVGIDNYLLINDNCTMIVYVSADPLDKNAWNNAWRRQISVIN